MSSTDPRRFLYRSLDPDGARRLAARHLSAHDDGELYLQYSASEAFGFDDGRLKTADYHSSSGFGLRGVSGETTAFAHANEISEAAIERAAATLKLLDPAKGGPAPSPPRTNQAMYGADDPLSLVPFADKVAHPWRESHQPTHERRQRSRLSTGVPIQIAARRVTAGGDQFDQVMKVTYDGAVSVA